MGVIGLERLERANMTAEQQTSFIAQLKRELEEARQGMKSLSRHTAAPDSTSNVPVRRVGDSRDDRR